MAEGPSLENNFDKYYLVAPVKVMGKKALASLLTLSIGSRSNVHIIIL